MLLLLVVGVTMKPLESKDFANDLGYANHLKGDKEPLMLRTGQLNRPPDFHHSVISANAGIQQ